MCGVPEDGNFRRTDELVGIGAGKMFHGFNESTRKYYEAIRKENSKIVHKENEVLYMEGVKQPLEELYFELYHYFSEFDRDLLGSKRRCISSAYNDARFCNGTPIKEYCYVRFKLDSADKKNALGFFFDASLDGYRYGLNIYNMDAKGMGKIRDYILDNRNFATDLIQKFSASGLLEVCGDMYKRPRYPDEYGVLQSWLEHKRISFMQEAALNPQFFDRALLDGICASFDSVREVYFMLKEALSFSHTSVY